MKKKTIWNSLMVCSIIVILISGLMVVGNLKGWFDKKTVNAEDSNVFAAIAAEKTGSVNIERKGIAYVLSKNDQFRDGDVIETLIGASATIQLGESYMTLNENSEAEIQISDEGKTTVRLLRGEAFSVISSKNFGISLRDAKAESDKSVVFASAPIGSENFLVFAGEATVLDEVVKESQKMSIVDGKTSVSSFSANTLNPFAMEYVRKVNETQTLCVKNEDLDMVIAEREAQKTAINDKKSSTDLKTDGEHSALKYNEDTTTEKESTGKGNAGNADKIENKGNTDKVILDKGEDDEVEEYAPSCTIQIVCDSILNNMGNLAEGKDKYVPSNGVIFSTTKMYFEEGDTVFDVLTTACGAKGIQLEYSWTPMYNSYYIEGIHHLYEFDCGSNSGWTYKVNGWFPNYGCSAYTVKDGDVIVWRYTCDGSGGNF